MNRRKCLLAITALAGVAGARSPALGQESKLRRIRMNWRVLAPEGLELPSPTDRIERSTEEWREMLEPNAFRILREEATEPAGSSPLNGEKRDGLYLCAGCGLALFSSEMKYDSGTGWPSFFTTIPDVFETKRDFVLFLPRTEYHCARCGGHHGHVFDDGPPPTNERWCNNGAALRFVPTKGSV
jgi:peptide-methionine (R)-S-oxide reductase